MNLNYLKEFVVLAETLNFQEAAYNLFISQSTLSKHIKTIEKELGIPLFERSTRNVQLNKYGQLFLPYAYKIIQIQNEYTSAIVSKTKNRENRIIIGSTAQIAHYSITEIIGKYKHQHLSTFVNVIIHPHKNLRNLLFKHEADFVFTAEPHNEYNEVDFNRVHFLSQSLVALLPNKHPLSASNTVLIESLKYEQLIMLDDTSIDYETFYNLCKQQGFEPNILIIPSGDMLVDFVKRGIGIAILWEVPAQNVFSHDVKISVIKPNTVMDINLLYLKDTKLTALAGEFLEYVKSFQDKEFPQKRWLNLL